MECNIISAPYRYFASAALSAEIMASYLSPTPSIVLVANTQQLVFRHDVLAGRFHMVFMEARLDDRINGASFFTEAAVNALKEINVVARRAARAVIGDVRFDRNRKRRANSLAKFARDAAFFTVRITTQCMQAAESRRLRRLLFRILERNALSEPVTLRNREPLEKLPESECLDVADNLIHRFIRPFQPMDRPGTRPSHLRRQSRQSSRE
jgi:hypothetical protein